MDKLAELLRYLVAHIPFPSEPHRRHADALISGAFPDPDPAGEGGGEGGSGEQAG